MKTLIAIPCMDTFPTQTVASLVNLDTVGTVEYGFMSGSLVYDSRNKIALKAIEGGYDFVLWMDSDMVFEPDVMKRLMMSLDSVGADIISGLYVRRKPPYSPVAFTRVCYEQNGNEMKPIADKLESYDDKIIEVEGIGFGCVLMRTSVLKALNEQFLPFSPVLGFGEDLSFCLRARQLGYKIYLDPAIKLGHVGYCVVTDNWLKK